MEDWSKSIFDTIESVAGIVDEFFLGVAEVVEEFAEEIENNVGTEIDQFFQDVFESVFDIYAELEELTGEPEDSFTYTCHIPATAEKNPACRGCSNYHGQVYGNSLLVCGMHPYGWNTENCPDWESN